MDSCLALVFVKIELVITDNKTGEEKVTEQDHGNYEMEIFQFVVLGVY